LLSGFGEILRDDYALIYVPSDVVQVKILDTKILPVEDIFLKLEKAVVDRI
jgi:hypothetical protein